MGSHCVDFLRELIVKVRPQQVSVLACVVLAGTNGGLAGSVLKIGFIIRAVQH